ncbi:hypothetical protein EVJ58_g8309 [Rhodofomes roseus]|uniref:Uncharacterized protein n=1 Tax=Rhodofomes roseus TaxID=34475 RepID=A0A4Y9Y182_9APHY|nr:hypothetical protein EVJ58_g8309 [Rhodofomes roseus]
MRIPSILKPSRRTEVPAPYTIKNTKRTAFRFGIEKMSFFGFTNPSATNKHFLDVPPAPSRKVSQRLMKPAARVEMEEFLSSEADDLELSFASTMSLNSPPRDHLDLDLESERENPDYAPMDISPAPPTRMQAPSTRSHNESVEKTRAFVGRPRAMTTNARLFGRDVSNNSSGNGSVSSLQSVAKSTGTNNAAKRLQRAALPFEWMATSSQNANVAPEVSVQFQASEPLVSRRDCNSWSQTWLTLCFLSASEHSIVPRGVRRDGRRFVIHLRPVAVGAQRLPAFRRADDHRVRRQQQPARGADVRCTDDHDF